jgi:hypothetical protein
MRPTIMLVLLALARLMGALPPNPRAIAARAIKRYALMTVTFEG